MLSSVSAAVVLLFISFADSAMISGRDWSTAIGEQLASRTSPDARRFPRLVRDSVSTTPPATPSLTEDAERSPEAMSMHLYALRYAPSVGRCPSRVNGNRATPEVIYGIHT